MNRNSLIGAFPFFALTTAATFCSSATPARADVLYEIMEPGIDHFGFQIAKITDLDGDGRPEIAVSAPLDDNGGVDSGAVYVYSGASGTLIRTICGEHSGDRFGWSICCPGDLDGDGFADLLIGAPMTDYMGPQSGSVYAASGATGAFLYRVDGDWSGYQFGHSLKPMGLVDADGVQDWVAGSPYDSSAGLGSLAVCSGSDGHRLYKVYALDATGSYSGYDPPLGKSVTTVPSAVGNGSRDIVVSWKGSWLGSNDGHVSVIDGRDGSLLAVYSDGSASVDWPSIAYVGDADGNGSPEIVLGHFQPQARFWEAMDVCTGVLISSGSPPSGSFYAFAQALASGGDRNGDGKPDIATSEPNFPGAGGPYSGRVYIFDVQSGSILTTYDGLTTNESLGYAFDDPDATGVAFVGDVDGDGLDDLAAVYVGSGGSGIRVYGGCDLPAPVNYCATSANSVGPGAVIGHAGPTSVSQNAFVLTASGCVPGQHGVFFYGPDQVQVPFGNGVRCVGGGFAGLFRLEVTQADVNGDAAYAVDFGLPPANQGPGAITAGSTWNFQFWYRDPAGGGAGYNLSDALQVAFCP